MAAGVEVVAPNQALQLTRPACRFLVVRSSLVQAGPVSWVVRQREDGMTHRDIAVSIAPILNHLLTVPPFDTPDGLDFGWFCREHALATKLIYNKLGVDCDIVRGQVAAYVAGEKRLATGAGADHDWCVTGELCPCDLSMTFRHLPGYPNLDTPVLGCQNHGSFAIVYCEDASEFPLALQSDECAVYFAPVASFRFTLQQCLSNPRPLRMSSRPHGIALACAAYLLDVMNTSNHLFQGDTPQDVALARVLAAFPNPKDILA